MFDRNACDVAAKYEQSIYGENSLILMSHVLHVHDFSNGWGW